MTDRFDRLPKWARKEVSDLRRSLARAEKERDQLKSTAFGGSGDVALVAGCYNEPDISLPDNCVIRFTFEDQRRIDVRRDGGAIYISSCPYEVAVHPAASNSIFVRAGKR